MSDIRNVILVTYDCARADVVWDFQNTTFSELASHGCQFRRAISSSPMTPVSHATIFTGLQPYNHGLRRLFREPLPETVPTLAEALSEQGFFTAALVSCPGLMKWYGHCRGFQHYDDWLPPLPDGSDPLSVPDVKLRGLALKRANQVSERAIDLIPGLKDKDRWFMFLHFFDAHWPYEPPETSDRQANPYEGELLFADKHLGRIVQCLKDHDAFDDTLIVILGDHGEDLAGWYPNDKSGAENLHPEEEGHGCCLYQQTQHVPLMFSHASIAERSIETQVGLIDVAPTIAGMLGADFRGQPDGVDLSGTIRTGAEPPERVLYAETMHPREIQENTGKFPEIVNSQCIWLDPQRKIMRWIGKSPEYVMFDLSADPLETNPLPAPDDLIARYTWPEERVGPA
ncbi:MAG: sulfatase [Rhodobacter sp.]|nr:sulfatase [Rhodobacter sp.]